MVKKTISLLLCYPYLLRLYHHWIHLSRHFLLEEKHEFSSVTVLPTIYLKMFHFSPNMYHVNRISCSHLFKSILGCWGKFFPFVNSFSYTYLLSCILFLFALRYFVNYPPLLRAVCKFGYSLLSRPVFTRVFTCLSVQTVFVAVFFFLGFPNHQPLLSSAFGKRLCFHRFLQFHFAVAFM